MHCLLPFLSVLALLQGVTMPDVKEFPISYWWGPPPAESTDARYKEIAAAGFNLANMAGPDKPGDFYPLQDKETNLKILDLCQKNGMKHLVSDKRMAQALNLKEGWEAQLDAIVEDYKNHPALYGYYVMDEPNADWFARLGAIVARLKEKDPAHVAYINLFPNYATPEMLKTADYREYLLRYINEVKPAFISYDHYHFLVPKEFWDKPLAAATATSTTTATAAKKQFASERDRQIYEAAHATPAKGGFDREGFFNNIEVVRELALAHKLPFTIIVLLTTHGPYRDLTEAELRWEAFQSLAYGTAGLSWFTYWAPPDDESWHFRHAIINWDGKPTDHYAQVQRVNAELKVVGGKLLGRASEAVYHVGAEAEKVKPFEPHSAVQAVAAGRAEQPVRFTIGFFEGGYTLLANKDHQKTTEATLTLAKGAKAFKVDKTNGNENPVKVEDGKLTLKLKAGDGELIRLEQAEKL